jgi:hypothetical protein
VNNADDQLVADYLAKLVTCAASLPPDRRDELVEEISGHIAEARQRPEASTDPAAYGVPAILARLGKPEDIVRSAAEQAGIPAAEFGAPGGATHDSDDTPGWGYDDRSAMAPPARRLGALEICAVILLLGGGFLAGIGWLVGLVLLWSSDRWRTSDKVLGTLIWPGGLATTFVLVFLGLAIPAGVSVCGTGSARSDSTASVVNGAVSVVSAGSCSSSPPVWLSLAVILAVVIAGIGGPIMVAIRLIRQAQAVPGEHASAHGTLSSSY